MSQLLLPQAIKISIKIQTTYITYVYNFTLFYNNILNDFLESHLLNHPWQGLLIEPGIWRELEDFSSGAVCMVIASDLFDLNDYIYDYDEFKKIYG